MDLPPVTVCSQSETRIRVPYIPINGGTRSGVLVFSAFKLHSPRHLHIFEKMVYRTIILLAAILGAFALPEAQAFTVVTSFLNQTCGGTVAGTV